MNVGLALSDSEIAVAQCGQSFSDRRLACLRMHQRVGPGVETPMVVGRMRVIEIAAEEPTVGGSDLADVPAGHGGIRIVCGNALEVEQLGCTQTNAISVEHF